MLNNIINKTSAHDIIIIELTQKYTRYKIHLTHIQTLTKTFKTLWMIITLAT